MESFKGSESVENREILKQLQGYLDAGYFLHGSKKRSETLEPRQARDTDPDRVAGKEFAVYAENADIRIPIFMAIRNPRGHSGYSGHGPGTPFYVSTSDTEFSVGYIHVLSPETFEIEMGKNEREFISRTPIVPERIIQISPSILSELPNFHIVSEEERKKHRASFEVGN